MSIPTRSFVDACARRGYDFFTGVPCSFLTPLINAVIADPALTYIGATSEGEALGVAAGAWIAGRKTVALCQNSGLGNMVNPLTSLNRPFRIPTLLLTTWRGEPGLKDEPQHEQMGRIIMPFLECLELPWRLFPEKEEEVEEIVSLAVAEAESSRRPFVLIVRRGALADGPPAPSPASAHRLGVVRDLRAGGPPRLTRTDALRAVLEACPPATAFIATTGMTGRELFVLRDQATNFYTVGSMGCASAIGLGLTLGRRPAWTSSPAAPATVVLDGDGAVLMKMGNLSSIGHYRAPGFVHVVLNNEAHDSTGGQATAASTVDFASVAASCGYASGTRVDYGPGLLEALRDALGRPGPHLIEVAIRPGSPRGIRRPTLTPEQIVDRFRRAVGGGP